MGVELEVVVAPEVAPAKAKAEVAGGEEVERGLCHEGDGVAFLTLNGVARGTHLTIGVVGKEAVPGEQLREHAVDAGMDHVAKAQVGGGACAIAAAEAVASIAALLVDGLDGGGAESDAMNEQLLFPFHEAARAVGKARAYGGYFEVAVGASHALAFREVVSGQCRGVVVMVVDANDGAGLVFFP